jgi:hypothetical protein
MVKKMSSFFQKRNKNSYLNVLKPLNNILTKKHLKMNKIHISKTTILKSFDLFKFKTTLSFILSFVLAFNAIGENVESPSAINEINPVAVCQNYFTQLDFSGTKQISPQNVNGGSFDPDGYIVDYSLDQALFTCDDLGVNVVTLTVEDNEGNTATCTANVTVTFPSQSLACVSQLNLALGLDGTATLEPEDVLAGSIFDPCDLFTVTPSFFTCDDIGQHTVIVEDGQGNSCWLTVVVEDKTPPNIIYPIDLTISGCADNVDPIITGEPVITDNCGTFAVNYQDEIFNLPGNSVKIIRTWTIIEWSSGDVYTHLQIIQVNDIQSPVAICQALVYVSLDQSGVANVPPEAVDAGSFDDCGDVTLALNPSTFNCSDIGNTIAVTLTVTDEGGNTNQCLSSIIVEDKIGPTAICNSQVNISLGANGTATITPAIIDAGSYDNCGAVTFELSQSTFECSDIGNTIVVILTVTDGSGNTNECWSEIVVEDKLAPTVTCPADLTLDCSQGGNLDPLITGTPFVVDNCNQIGYAYEDLIIPTCGAGYKVLRTWTVVDWNSGSIQECIQVIKVWDVTPPTLVCVNQLSASLDLSGNLTLFPEDFVVSATDDCDTVYLSLLQNQFDCSDIGNTTVEIIATDGCGNSSLCYVNLTIEDTTSPLALCNAQVNISLGIDGTATITPAQIDAGSFDECGAVTLSISQSTFDCSDIGNSIVVILTVTDGSGNTNECWTQIVVEDKLAPTVTCPTDLTLDCSQGGNLDPLITGTPFVVDNCNQIGYAYEDLIIPTCGAGFKVLRTWTVVDWYSGSVQECIQVIKVVDVTPPTLVCVNQLSASLDFSGNLTLLPEDFVVSATDACDTVYLSLLQNQFDCSDIGDTTVVITATDGCGSASQCYVTLTIEDTTSPLAVCNAQVNISLGLDGTATITPGVIDAGSFDECGAVTLSISQSTFDCSDIGDSIVVIMTVTDESGNTNECWTEIVVEDNLPPVVTCPNDLTLDCSVGDNIDPSIIGYPNVVDNCDFIGYSWEDQVFQLGGVNFKVLRTWIVVDLYSNGLDTCIQVIKVLDTTPPNLVCLNQLVASLDANGILTLFPGDFDAGTSDDCGTFELSISQSQFDCSDVGSTTITVTAVDNSGNQIQCQTNLIISGLDSDGDGFSLCEGDCNDNNALISPGSMEICNDGIDNNCDSEVDENCICPSYGQSTQIEWIESISVNSTANSTGDDGGYGDYTSVTLQVDIGNNSVQLVPGFSGNKKKEFWSIWIDFNHNAVFDGNEEVFNDDSKFVINGSFAIPNSALLGVTTMRIAMRYNQYSDPCEIFARGEVEDYSVNINEPFQCISGGQSTQNEWINKVQLKSINNQSGNDNGYADFTNLSTNLNPGQSKNIKLKPGFSGSSNVEYWRVWVDWNVDGDFDDAGELEVETSSSGNVTEQITVPPSASGGDKVMRVSMKYDGYADPCEEFTYGEVEDYTIFVTGSNTILDPSNLPDALTLEDQKTESLEIGKRDFDEKFEMKIYPNPVSNILSINISSSVQQERTIKLYNQLGQIIYEAQTIHDQHSIDVTLDKFTNGMYMVVIQQGREVESQKILITK